MSTVPVSPVASFPVTFVLASASTTAVPNCVVPSTLVTLTLTPAPSIIVTVPTNVVAVTPSALTTAFAITFAVPNWVLP